MPGLFDDLPGAGGGAFDDLPTVGRASAFDDLPETDSAIAIAPRTTPRDGMELAARNFAGTEAVRKELAKRPREAALADDTRSTPEKWWDEFKNSYVVRNIFGNPGAKAGGDLEREGAVSTLASIPARVGTTTGRLAKAGVADLAAAMRNDETPEGDFSGNVKAALLKDDTLPIERALKLSQEDDHDRHALGWQTIAADISLGLADMAPKIAMLEAAPGGALAKSGAAAEIFGFDEQNKFQPKSAAFAVAFPFVTEAAATATDQAIKVAVERGFEWAGKPAAQRALHVAANQAAMNAVMTAQSAPELSQLAQSDPQEFKRQFANIIGGNLAFAIPEAMKEFQPIQRQGAESAKTQSEPEAVPVTRDLAAELEASMRGNQVKTETPAAGTKRDLSDQSATIEDTLKQNRVYQAQEEIKKAAAEPKPAEAVAPAVSNDTKPEDLAAATGFDYDPRMEQMVPGRWHFTDFREGSPTRALSVTVPAGASTAELQRAIAERETLKQTDEFHKRAVQGNRPKAERGRTERIPVGQLLEGDTFKVQNHNFEVKHLEFDDAGNLVYVEVKDGPKFGVQRIGPDEAEFIHVDRNTFEEGPAHDGNEVTRPAPDVPGNAEIGGATKGEPLTLETEASQATASVEDPQAKKRDAIENWLDQAIENTKPDDWTGNVSMGLAKIPVWLTKETAHLALKVIRATYQAGKSINEAIAAAVEYLRAEKIKGFDEAEARTFLTQAAKEANPVIQRLPESSPAGNPAEVSRVVDELEAAETERAKLKARSAEIPKELTERIATLTEKLNGLKNWKTEPETESEPEPAKETEAPKEPETPIAQSADRTWQQVETEMEQASQELRAALKKNSPDQAGGMRKADVRQEQALAAAKYRSLKDELIHHQDYVADLLTRHEAAVNAGDSGKAEAEELKTRLEEIPPKLLNRVHDELQKNGKLAKSAAPPPQGRSLDDLTDWLKAAGVDSPKRSLRERLALGQKIADRWHALKDATEQARLKLGLAWKTALESIKHPPIDTGFRNVIKDWKFMDEWTGQQTARWVRTINAEVENPTRQMAISIWLDAGGDQSLLRYQAAAVPERYAAIWRIALELTPKEKELALRIKRDFEDKLNDGKNAGLIEKGRDDYGVPQLWKKPPGEMNDQTFATADGPKGSPGNWKARLDPRDPFFSFQRTHPTYFDGIMAGGVPQSLRISDLVSVYNTAFHKSLTSRSAIWALKNENAADGLPIVKISGSARQMIGPEAGSGTYFVDSKTRTESDVAADGRPYRPIDHFAMRDWKVAYKTSDGKTVLVRGDMLIHPDHYEFLKNELGQSALREGAVGRVVNPILKANTFLKASKLALGTFHLATIGEHAIFHWMNPITKGFEIDLRKPDQALLVRNGLELGMSGPQMAFEEGLASHGGLFDKVPLLGDASRKFSDWLFKDYIPALSMKAGLEVLKRNRQRYGKELSESQIAELTAHQMNAAFGLQNYRLLGRNKTLLDLNRMALLAPQFLYSRAKVVGQALKPYGAEQRRMLIWQAATLYVGARILNSLLDGDPHWEAENAFSVIYHKRAYTIRTIVGDLWHLLMDPKSFAAGRLSPLSRLGFETISQRDLRTGARKEPPIQTEWVPGRVAQNLVVDLAKWMLPVGSEGLLPGAAGREQGPVDSALASVGIGSHKYTAQTQVWGWASDFNRNSDDPATRTWQRHRDAAVKGESAYRKLDALLDAGKLEDAQKEYEDLQADGHKPETIQARYRRSMPFTGSLEGERAFKASLNAEQQRIYERALQERRERAEKFQQLLQLAPVP